MRSIADCQRAADRVGHQLVRMTTPNLSSESSKYGQLLRPIKKGQDYLIRSHPLTHDKRVSNVFVG